MAKRINFFATRNDMVLLLKELEISFEVKYVLSYDTMVISNKILEYSSVESIPNLDNLRKKHSEKMFLIMRQGAVPLKKKTPGGVRKCFFKGDF